MVLRNPCEMVIQPPREHDTQVESHWIKQSYQAATLQQLPAGKIYKMAQEESLKYQWQSAAV